MRFLLLWSTLVLTPQDDDSIDAVVAFNPFQQLRSEQERIDTYMAEVARVLKPGGALVFFERGECRISSSMMRIGVDVFARPSILRADAIASPERTLCCTQ